METQDIPLDHNRLHPHFNYTVDVQAKMCSNNLYRGPWSEWSATTEWRTTGTDVEDEGKRTLYLPTLEPQFNQF